MDGMQVPPMPAAEDLPPNINAGDGLCIMTWVLLGTSTVFVGGRIMSKMFVLRRFRWDDVFMLLTWATSIAYSACIQLSYHYGLGRHYFYVDMTKALDLVKWAYICQVFCILTPLVGRISVFLYTLSLLGKTKRSLRYSLWMLLFLQVIFNVSIALTLLGVCGTDFHVIANPGTTCYRQSPWSRYAQFVGAFNAFTDGALTLAPVFVIAGLKTTWRAKVAASTLLGLSSLAMIAAIWRTVELENIFAADWDFTYNATPYFYASSFEQSTIMIIGCIPTLGPLLKHTRRTAQQQQHKAFKPSPFSSSNASAHNHNHSTATTLTPSSTTISTTESVQIQKTLAEALGIHMPGLGNHVTITAGGKDRNARNGSRDSELPLSDIKTTVSTDVRVESVPASNFYAGAGEREDDVEKLFSMPTVLSREGK